MSHYSPCIEEGPRTSNRLLEYPTYEIKRKKISHRHSVDGLHEHSSLSDKVILEKSASLLENLVTEVVIHMLVPQYIKMTMEQRKEKTHLI